MWISKKVYEQQEEVRQYALARNEAIYADLAVRLAELRELERTNAILQTNLDWFRLRVSQLEKERAQLMLAVTGIKVPVPEFVSAQESVDAMSEVPSFEDMGDAAAKAAGIDWTPEGTVDYSSLPKRQPNGAPRIPTEDR